MISVLNIHDKIINITFIENNMLDKSNMILFEGLLDLLKIKDYGKIVKLLTKTKHIYNTSMQKEIDIISQEWYNYESDVIQSNLAIKDDFILDNSKVKNKIVKITNSIIADNSNNNVKINVTAPHTNNVQNKHNYKKIVFISYNNKDEKMVNKLHCKLLNSEVYSIIYTKEAIGSEKILNFIDKKISSSEAIIQIISKHSLASSWVSEEISLSMIMERTVNKKIFVCIIDNTINSYEEITKIILALREKIQSLKLMKKEREKDDIPTMDIDRDLQMHIEHETTLIDKIAQLREKPYYILFEKHFSKEYNRLVKDILNI